MNTILELLALFYGAITQAIAETWLWLLLCLVAVVVGALCTKPWNYKNMKAWLHALEEK